MFTDRREGLMHCRQELLLGDALVSQRLAAPQTEAGDDGVHRGDGELIE